MPGPLRRPSRVTTCSPPDDDDRRAIAGAAVFILDAGTSVTCGRAARSHADLQRLARLRGCCCVRGRWREGTHPRAVRQLDKSKPPFGFEPFDDSAYRRSRGRLEPRWGKTRRASEFTQMRIVAIIVEVAASAPTKIPVSDQIGFLSNRFTAQSRPRRPIVPKNRAGREWINLQRQDCAAPRPW